MCEDDGPPLPLVCRLGVHSGHLLGCTISSFLASSYRMNNCVGEMNRKYFFLFCAYVRESAARGGALPCSTAQHPSGLTGQCSYISSRSRCTLFLLLLPHCGLLAARLVRDADQVRHVSTTPPDTSSNRRRQPHHHRSVHMQLLQRTPRS